MSRLDSPDDCIRQEQSERQKEEERFGVSVFLELI
jgi:hypothetical protein